MNYAPLFWAVLLSFFSVASEMGLHAESASELPASAPTLALTSAPISTSDPAQAPATGELTLEQCYQEALDHNPVIRSAKALFEEALGTKLILQSSALPLINAGALAGQQGPRYLTSNPTAHKFFLITGSFTQALYNAAIPASFRLGKIELAVAQQQFNRQTMSELYDLRLAFYQALNARDNIEVQKTIHENAQVNLKAQQDAQIVGKASAHEVSQAAVQVAGIEPGLAQAKSDYLKWRITLAQKMGRPLDASVDTEGLPIPAGTLQLDPLVIDYESDIAYALHHRPDLLALRALIAASKENQKIDEAGYYPVINLAANMQYIPQTAVHKSGTVVQADNSVESSQIFYGISYSWQIIDTGTVRGAAQSEQSTRESYEIDLKRLEENVPRVLRQIEGELHSADAMLDGSEQNIALAERNLVQVKAQVANGDAPQLDFLNAQGNLLQARFHRLNALLENNIAVAQFDIVTGRYLEFVEKSASSNAKTDTTVRP